MALRETLNKYPKVAVGVLAIVVTASISLAFRMGSDSAGGVPTQLYYSADDGQSFFVDNAERIPPFDHGGKQAVRASVYRYGASGKPFVAYLERLNADGQKKVLDPQLTSDQRAELASRYSEIKKPGEKDWVRANSAAASRVMARKPPQGATEELEPVFP
jgi:hypothetical protein